MDRDDLARESAAGDGAAVAVGGRVITALVLLNVEPGRVRSLAEELLEIDGVTECYSVAGPYDLVAIVRVREHEQLSDLVTERIAAHAGINATETLIAFRAFAKRDLGMVWDIGVD
jgi:DNA-binding Lrp family transcriptional regulator